MFHVEHPGFDSTTPLGRQLADLAARKRQLSLTEVPAPARTRILTVTNQKGGVGKTTTVVNLAAALAAGGLRVLVVDLDPQGNASTALGVTDRNERKSVYDVLINDIPLADCIVTSGESTSLLCVPANLNLAGAEIELVNLGAREYRLWRALDVYMQHSEERVDYIFIDCPPSLGLLTVNAFVAAQEVLIPIQCEYYALEGLSQLLTMIERIRDRLNPELQLTTILLTMYDARTRLASDVADQVREHFPRQTLRSVIPRSVRVSEAPSYGSSVVAYDPGSAGAVAYREAALEIAQKGVM